MSYADDLVKQRLAVAEATGDVPRSKRELSLENYVRVTKRIKLDLWQVDLCRRLEKAFWLAQSDKFEFEFFDIGAGAAFRESPSGLHINAKEFDERKNTGTRAAIHAPPQYGKSIIISQAYPGWIFGWNPTHRFRLATYNILHSARFSVVIKQTMQSPEHKSFFPDPAGHIIGGKTKIVEWSTNARKEINDGQASFSALGLQSGFVGTGADTLLADDPYKSVEEALSDILRDKTWRFWTDTAAPRMNEQSNVFIMFHRYHQDDMGGRAISSGDFEYLWRYAAQADGDYEDEDSGRTFSDPINRKEGEYLSARFGELYYARQRKNEWVWYSQFQGRPSAKSGKMFTISLLKTISRNDVPEILHWVRAWDNAATSGGGAYTAGPLMGIDATENIYFFDVVREQVDSAERQMLQQSTAEQDGKLVEIHAPEDPGAAGKQVAFEFQQVFARQGYKVTITKAGAGEDGAGTRVYGRSKVMRAYNYSKAVNMGKVFLVLNADGSVPKWHKLYKTELQFFPNSTYKDQVDASADGYNHLMKLFYRGLVIKSASDANLLHRSLFVRRFGEKIPSHWEVAAAVRVAEDSSRPSGYAVVARAAENAYLGEAAFVVAAARIYADNPVLVLKALQAALVKHCAKGVAHPSIIWLNKGANEIAQVAAQKLDMHIREFTDDASAGIPETNFYFQRIERISPFYDHRVGAALCYVLVDDFQYEKKNVQNEEGMLSLRQDCTSWTYTDKGEAQPFAGITLDCVRMTLYKFALSATGLTDDERRWGKLPKELQPAAVAQLLGTPQFVEAHLAQEHALFMARVEEEETKISDRRAAIRGGMYIGARAVTRRFRGRL